MSQEQEKICFCWNINYSCNYRCPYCFFYGRWEQVKKDDGNFSAEEWINSWHRIYDIYGSVRIETAGGEPFIFPSFVKCINEICKIHIFRVTTNLSCSIKTLNSIVRQNSSEKLKWNVSFHPSFSTVDNFLEKVSFLKENNFEVLVMYVAYPSQLKQLEYYKGVCQEKGITFFIQAYQGEYNGISYPGGYSDEERQKIYALEDYNAHHGSFKKLIDNQLLQKKTKGKLCLSGSKYAFIDSNGTVYRCTRERKHPMGNFLHQDFRLLERPLPCEFEDCPCEFTWLAEENQEICSEDSEEEEKILISTDSTVTKLCDKSRVQQPSDKYPIHGRIFWSWDIHYLCNYKCSYCWLFKPHTDAPKDKHHYPGIDNLLKIWNKVYDKYKKCHIHISGGEPSLYPSFNEFLAELSTMHSVEFDTNLSFDIDAFIKKLGQGPVKINASFHPEFVDFDTFLSNVLQLKEHQFEIGIGYVAYPILLETMEMYREISRKNNINFTIQAYRGEFNGKEYPSAYTDSEKKLVGICGNDSTQKIFQHHTEDAKKNERRLCRMGQMYAKIYPNGDVLRCCIYEKHIKIDNIFDNYDFKLLDEPTYCEIVPCPCWRAMIVGKENEWQQYWYIM